MLLSLASPLSWPILPKLRSQCRSPAVGKVGIVSSPSLLFSMLLPPPHTNTSLQTTSCVQATPWKEARGVQKKSWGEENGFTWHFVSTMVPGPCRVLKLILFCGVLLCFHRTPPTYGRLSAGGGHCGFSGRPLLLFLLRLFPPSLALLGSCSPSGWLSCAEALGSSRTAQWLSCYCTPLSVTQQVLKFPEDTIQPLQLVP